MSKNNSSIPEIYAFGVITPDFIAKLVDELRFYSQFADSINVHLNSPGGSIYDGIAGYNAIKNCPVPVDIYVDGVAASMGAYMAFAGRKVYMSKYARLMLHEGSTPEGGNAHELRAMAEEVEACNNNLLAMTCEKTGMVEADARAKFFNGTDNWYNAKEAIALKLADGIYDQDKVAVPEATDHLQVYAMLSDAYINGVFKTENYMDFKLSNETVAVLDLKPGYDVNAVNTAVQALANKNKELSQKLTDQATASLEKEVNAMLDGAMAAKKISAQQKGIFAKQYAQKPEDLKEVLASMGAFVSVTDRLIPVEKGAYAPEVVALMAQGWDKLDKGDQLPVLKALSEEAYLDVYKAKHGFLPNEKPKPYQPGDRRK